MNLTELKREYVPSAFNFLVKIADALRTGTGLSRIQRDALMLMLCDADEANNEPQGYCNEVYLSLYCGDGNLTLEEREFLLWLVGRQEQFR